MPADEQQVVGAVGFFEDYDDGVVAIQVGDPQICKVGGSFVEFISAVGAYGTCGYDCYAAATKKFERDFLSRTVA